MLREAFVANAPVELTDGTLEESRARMSAGDLDGILVIPQGLAAAIEAAQGGGGQKPVAVTIITDPSRSGTSQAVQQIATGLVMAANLQLSGATPILTVDVETLQTSRLNSVSFFVPSILAMALMQLGIFAAIPLVEQREKLILKRLNATPLPRWTLVGSNVIVRLLIAAAQTAIIVGIGVAVLGVEIVGNWALIAGFVVLGALSFTAIGYVIASFARTEEAANGMTQIVQFPLMFLSGHLLPARGHARLAAGGRDIPAPDLPRRRPAPDDGRRHALRAPRPRRAGARRLAGRYARDLRPLFPLAMSRTRTPNSILSLARCGPRSS